MDSQSNERDLMDRLNDILLAIQFVRSDIGAMTRDEFRGDGKTQRAVIQSLMVASEAAGEAIRLEPKLEHQSPAVWSELIAMREMRGRLSTIDTGEVWEAVAITLLRLDAAVFQLLTEKIRSIGEAD